MKSIYVILPPPVSSLPVQKRKPVPCGPCADTGATKAHVVFSHFYGGSSTATTKKPAPAGVLRVHVRQTIESSDEEGAAPFKSMCSHVFVGRSGLGVCEVTWPVAGGGEVTIVDRGSGHRTAWQTFTFPLAEVTGWYLRSGTAKSLALALRVVEDGELHRRFRDDLDAGDGCVVLVVIAPLEDPERSTTAKELCTRLGGRVEARCGGGDDGVTSDDGGGGSSGDSCGGVLAGVADPVALAIEDLHERHQTSVNNVLYSAAAAGAFLIPGTTNEDAEAILSSDEEDATPFKTMCSHVFVGSYGLGMCEVKWPVAGGGEVTIVDRGSGHRTACYTFTFPLAEVTGWSLQASTAKSLALALRVVEDGELHRRFRNDLDAAAGFVLLVFAPLGDKKRNETAMQLRTRLGGGGRGGGYGGGGGGGGESSGGVLADMAGSEAQAIVGLDTRSQTSVATAIKAIVLTARQAKLKWELHTLCLFFSSL